MMMILKMSYGMEKYYVKSTQVCYYPELFINLSARCGNA